MKKRAIIITTVTIQINNQIVITVFVHQRKTEFQGGERGIWSHKAKNPRRRKPRILFHL